MPAFKSRVGERRKMNNGLYATVIKYRNSKDIDVQFDDGVVVRHKYYHTYLHGSVGHPNISNHKKSYVGVTRVMNNGMLATVIRSDGSQDVDIQFEDGIVLEHREISSFMRGEVAHPNVKTKNSIFKRLKSERLGLSKTMNCGSVGTIIRYGRSDDIDVKFSDGYVAEHRTYTQFQNGEILNHNLVQDIHESRNEFFMRCCLEPYGFVKINSLSKDSYDLGLDGMELDLFHPELKIGIEYDGVFHTDDRDLRKTELCLDNGISLFRIKESRNCTKDDSRVKTYRVKDRHPFSENMLNIINDIIMKLNLGDCHLYDMSDARLFEQRYYDSQVRNSRVGESNISTKGEMMKITKYNNSSDIDVEFEDGVIVFHKSYDAFKKGYILHPKRYKKSNITNTNMV